MKVYRVIIQSNSQEKIQAGTLTNAGLCIDVEERAKEFKYLVRKNIYETGTWLSEAILKPFKVILESNNESEPEHYTASPELILKLCKDYGVEPVSHSLISVTDEYFDIVRDCSYPSHHKCYCTDVDQCPYLMAIPKQLDEPEHDVSQETLWKEVDTIIENDLEEFFQSEKSYETEHERFNRLIPKLMNKFFITRRE